MTTGAPGARRTPTGSGTDDGPVRAPSNTSSGSPSTRSRLEAMDAIDAGRSVLVSAPTGSGKTVVAEYAVARAARPGWEGLLHHAAQGPVQPEVRRPRRRYGDRAGRPADRRHLATRPDAPVVVMTTEVLRNMLFARRRRSSRGWHVVVLDEVHYLQDPYRGAVWEEVLVLTPPDGDLRLPLGHGGQRRGLRRLADVGARARPGWSSRPTDRSRSTTTTAGRAGDATASPSSRC